MTDGSAGNPQPPEPGSGQDPKKRKVAKTRLENQQASPEMIAAAEAANAAPFEPTVPVQVQPISPQIPPAMPQAAAQEAPVRERRVAKTRIFGGDSATLPVDSLQSETPAENAPIKPKTRSLTGKRVSKTLVFNPLEDMEEERLTLSTPDAMNEPDSAPLGVSTYPKVDRPDVDPEPRQHYIVKTRLDNSILYDAVSKFAAKKEEKAVEEARERAKEPPKPRIEIEKFKLSPKCPWVWEESMSRERVRYCGKCQLQVYNFDGLELPEAESLIYKRENKKKFTLFKRGDGKFMTVTCPVEAKRKQDLILYSILGVLLLIGAIVILSSLPKSAPQSAPPVVQEEDAPWHPGATTTTPSSSSSSSSPKPAGKLRMRRQKDGSYRYDAGDTSPAPEEVKPVKAPQPIKAPDADEDGQFWQYSNGQR